MFTGIIKGVGQIKNVESTSGTKRIAVELENGLIEGLQVGASVSVDGVCLTATAIEGSRAFFDLIQETLNRTTLDAASPGAFVNIERAAKFSDEIGGHLLSGHIYDTAVVEHIENPENNFIITFTGKALWMKYLFSKGYIAIDGASLTLVDVNRTRNLFSVHLIPETLRMTTLGTKKIGSRVNIEIDAQTQAIVDTVERMNRQYAPNVAN